MPIILAHATPNPAIGTNNKFLSVICGKTNKPIAAMIKQITWIIFGLIFFANQSKKKALTKVIILYQPFTNPDQPTASS